MSWCSPAPERFFRSASPRSRRANGIDRLAFGPAQARFGLVTAGKAYQDTMQALNTLGLDAARAQALGIAVYKVGMIWPLEPEGITAFAAGKQELMFIEEKNPFVESQSAALLYNLQRPLAVGDSVRLTVQLQSGRTATTTAPVVAFAELERVLADSGSMPPSGGTPSLVEGKALYRSNGCITCHGPVGYGDGVVGRTLVPPPRDFRDSLAFKAGRDGAHIAKMLVLGIPAGGNMPLYAHLSNQQRASLALYVISLRDTSVSDAH